MRVPRVPENTGFCADGGSQHKLGRGKDRGLLVLDASRLEAEANESLFYLSTFLAWCCSSAAG